jgi:hypothetical protein
MQPLKNKNLQKLLNYLQKLLKQTLLITFYTLIDLVHMPVSMIMKKLLKTQINALKSKLIGLKDT